LRWFGYISRKEENDWVKKAWITKWRLQNPEKLSEVVEILLDQTTKQVGH